MEENKVYHAVKFDSSGAIRSKHSQLDVFLETFAYLPEQGSKAWLASKHGDATKPPTIGGSEISTLLGENHYHYQGLKELYETKLGISTFSGNAFTQWGNMCEPVIQKFCDGVTESVTYETGSIPGLRDSDGNVIQTYSPDGLNVMPKKRYLELCDEWVKSHPDASAAAIEEVRLAKKQCSEISDDWVVNLMEFKCPAIRVPSGEVPKQYVSQPKIGAATLRMVETALFADAVIRLCSLTNLLRRKSTYIHNKEINGRYNKLGSRYPVAVAFVGVYHRDESASGEVKREKREKERVREGQSLVEFATEVAFRYISDPEVSSAESMLQFVSEEAVSEAGGEARMKEMLEVAVDYAVQFSDDRIRFLTDLTENKSDQEFCELMSRVVSNRFDSCKYQTWYSSVHAVRGEWEKLRDAKTRTAMLREINWFMNYCLRDGVTAVGVVPLAVLQVEVVPVAKDSGFRDRHESEIRRVVKDIESIKMRVASESSDERKKEVAREEVSARFGGGSSKSRVVSEPEKKIEIETEVASESDWDSLML
jgi:hypothetical protein